MKGGGQQAPAVDSQAPIQWAPQVESLFCVGGIFSSLSNARQTSLLSFLSQGNFRHRQVCPPRCNCFNLGVPTPTPSRGVEAEPSVSERGLPQIYKRGALYRGHWPA